MQNTSYKYFFTNIFLCLFMEICLVWFCFQSCRKLFLKVLNFFPGVFESMIKAFPFQRTKDIFPHFLLLILLFHFFHLNKKFHY